LPDAQNIERDKPHENQQENPHDLGKIDWRDQWEHSGFQNRTVPNQSTGEGRRNGKSIPGKNRIEMQSRRESNVGNQVRS
jgi:hypothetical protein